ncbi:MAG: rod shape-determining protein MreC [Alphaproteobacteria bacterium]|nr:rod shape-determining protein MreC [Alphaproteobacteria bacterium]
MAQRFAFLFLLVAAGGVLLIGKADPKIFDRTRMVVTDTLAPILDALSRPIATGAAIVDEVQYLVNLRQENAALRSDNARLIQWHTAARNLAAENKRLRGLLQFVPEQASQFISARVIADSGGTFVRSMLVNAGRADGARKGLPVVVGEGLIGRIVDSGERSSRVLLVDDLNSRIPVVVGPDRERAVLAGDNSRRPKLIYLAANAQVQQGARIMTSGQGGVFPPGIPVGVVSSINANGVRVESFVAASDLEYVRIIDYGLAGVLERDRRDGTARGY